MSRFRSGIRPCERHRRGRFQRLPSGTLARAEKSALRGDFRRAEHRVEEPWEAFLEILSAKRHESLRTFDPCPRQSCLPQHLQVVGESRLGNRAITQRTAIAFPFAIQGLDDLEPDRVAQSVEKLRKGYILRLGMADDPHLGGGPWFDS